MNHFKKDLDREISVLERKDQEVLKVLDHFQHSLTCLSYEGKPLFGRNLRRTREEAGCLRKKLSEVFRVEDKAVFPFMEKHVPKLEPVIHALESDHRDLKGLCDIFDKRTRRLLILKSRTGKERLFREIKEGGAYMICFVRHHLETKRALIYKSVRRYLKEEEVGIFSRQIKRVCGE
jgi:hypothetical protein